MENLNSEYKFLGKNIESISLYYGIFLILWGLTISFISKSSSFTSYIPSYLGVVIFLFSTLSTKFTSKKKLFMHIVAFTGLITFLGGLDVIRLIIKKKLILTFVNFYCKFFYFFPIRKFIGLRSISWTLGNKHNKSYYLFV